MFTTIYYDSKRSFDGKSLHVLVNGIQHQTVFPESPMIALLVACRMEAQHILVKRPYPIPEQTQKLLRELLVFFKKHSIEGSLTEETC